MIGILSLARVRRALLVVGLAFASLPVGSALAATTVGQTGAPVSGTLLGGGEEVVQTDAVMPAAGVVAGFHTQSSSSCFTTGSFDFQVLRPLGGDQYRVLGDTGNQVDPCDGQLHSYVAHIPVRAGDVIGVYVVNAWQGLLSATSGSVRGDFIPEPAPGAAITLTIQQPDTLDESATLVSTQNDDSQGQNNDQGENKN